MKVQRSGSNNKSAGDGRLGRWLSFKRSDDFKSNVAGLSVIATADAAGINSAAQVPCQEQLHPVSPGSSTSRRSSRRSLRKNSSRTADAWKIGHHRFEISPESFPAILSHQKAKGKHRNSAVAAMPDTHMPAFEKPISDREVFRRTLDRLKSSNYGMSGASTSDSLDRHIVADPRYLIDSDSDQDSSEYPPDPVLAAFVQTASDVQVFERPKAVSKDQPSVLEFSARRMSMQHTRSKAEDDHCISSLLLQRGVSEPARVVDVPKPRGIVHCHDPYFSVEHACSSLHVTDHPRPLPLEQAYGTEDSDNHEYRNHGSRLAIGDQISTTPTRTHQEATLSRLIATSPPLEEFSDEDESMQCPDIAKTERTTRRQAKPSIYSSLQANLARISNHSRTKPQVVEDDFSSMQETSTVAIEPSIYLRNNPSRYGEKEKVRRDLYASTEEDEDTMIRMAMERSVRDLVHVGQSERNHSGEDMRLSLNRFVQTKNPIPCSAISVSSASAPYSLSSMSTDYSMQSAQYRSNSVQQVTNMRDHANQDNQWSSYVNVSPVSHQDDMSERFAELEQERELIELAMERSLQDSQEMSYREDDFAQDDFPVSYIDVDRTPRPRGPSWRDYPGERLRHDNEAITSVFERHQRMLRVACPVSHEGEEGRYRSGGRTESRFDRQGVVSGFVSSNAGFVERQLNPPSCNQESEAARMERLEREMLEKALELSLMDMSKRRR